MYLVCTFFLSLSTITSIFSKTSHHFVTIKNDTKYDLSLSELTQNNPQHQHTINARSEKKCNFFKSTDCVEAKIKIGSVYYNVCCPITSGHKTVTITQNQTLHIRAQ